MRKVKPSVSMSLLVAGWVLISLPVVQAQNKDSRIEGDIRALEASEEKYANRELHDVMPDCKRLLSALKRKPTPFPPAQNYLYKWEVSLFQIDHELLQRIARHSMSTSGQILADILDMDSKTYEDSEYSPRTTTWPLGEEYLDDIAIETNGALPELATECIKNVELLASHLGRVIEKSDNSPDEYNRIVQTRNQLLELGYYLATNKSTRLDFAGQRYISYLRANRTKQAELWRNQVIEESQLLDLPVDDESVGDSLSLLCYVRGHNMRLAELCLRTIERAIVSALAGNKPIPHSVYSGAKELMLGLTGLRHESISHERRSIFSDDRSKRIYVPSDVAYIGPCLREVLELIPTDHQDMSFYRAYRFVVGERTRIQWLNDMAMRNPEDAAIQEELRLLQQR